MFEKRHRCNKLTLFLSGGTIISLLTLKIGKLRINNRQSEAAEKISQNLKNQHFYENTV